VDWTFQYLFGGAASITVVLTYRSRFVADSQPISERSITQPEFEYSGKDRPLTPSDLPVSAGLRAVAEEIPRRPVAEAMRRMAAELDRGVSLDVALGEASNDVPDYLRGLILAGLRTGRVAHVLEELMAMDQERADLRRRVLAALMYPTILVFLFFLVLVFGNVFIMKPFSRMYEEWGVELPGLTLTTMSAMNWFDRTGLASTGITLGIVMLSFAVLLMAPKPPELQRVCYRLPIIGPVWRWQSLVDFSRLMHLLLDRQVPMVEALRLTADGLRWSDLAAASRACAADVERGAGLSESIARYREFPASIHPVIASGIRSQRPAEGFAAAADMYRRRAGVDAMLWETILPPIILVLVAMGLGLLVLSMFLPLIKLISSLS
jgi:type II secretory pathway component PulF